MQCSSKAFKQLPVVISSSDDDDFDLPPLPLPKRPPKKKSRKEDSYEDVILERLQSIENTIEKLKEDKNASSSTAASGSSQQQVTEMLSNSLKCIICTMILDDDSLILTCCNQIGCCESCLKQWLDESSTCPHCRSSLTLSSCIKIPSSFRDILQVVKQQSSEAV